MKSNKTIIEEVRKETEIPIAVLDDVCFYGEYVPDMIEKALQIQKEDIFNEIQLVIDKYNKVLDNYEYKAEVNSRKIDEAIVYNLIKLKQKLEEKDGKTNT